MSTVTVTILPIALAGERECPYCDGSGDLEVEPSEDGPCAEACYVCRGSGEATRCGCCAVAGAPDAVNIAAIYELRARGADGREHWRRVCFRGECAGEALGELHRTALAEGRASTPPPDDAEVPWTFGLCGGLVL